MAYNNLSSSYLNDQGASIEFPNIRNRTSPKKPTKPIVVNLADTQYEVIEKVAQELGWKPQFNDSKTWDLKWHDSAITVDVLSKMSPHQKINHFPGMNTLHRKNNLAKNLYRLQEQHPDDYDFFPRTFLLPHDTLRLRSYFQEIKKRGIQKTFIVKPEANCQGRGIFLTQDITEIMDYEHCIVQKYVSNPLLYKGLKFDMRIYALVAGCDPLRVYIYNEGLVRFATEKYEFPDEENMDDLCMHLTNYAINKDSPKYVYNESLDNLSYGHKKSLAEFFQTLKALGFKAHQYWADIKDIIIKTLVSGQPHLQHEYRSAQPHNLPNNMCFEVLGFDFMMDANGKVYLLEINHTPSFTTDTPLDELIKSNLIRDTLLLMNVTPKARNQTIQETREAHQRRVFTGKTLKLTPQERKAKVQEQQQAREEYEKYHLGSFQRIFPSKVRAKQEKYMALLESSERSYKELTGGNNYRQAGGGVGRKSPAKFRIVKRINTNQSYGEEEGLEYEEGGESYNNQQYVHNNNNQHHLNNNNNQQYVHNNSINLQHSSHLQQHSSSSKKHVHGSIHKSLGLVKQQGESMSKRSGLKTSNEEMTMFSRKMDSQRQHRQKVHEHENEEQQVGNGNMNNIVSKEATSQNRDSDNRIAIDIHV